MNRFRHALVALLVCSVCGLALAKEKIKTDGKNKKSPIKVTRMDFLDSGYGQPGPNSEIRISTAIQNSGKDELKNVVLHLQLKNLAGDVVKEWVHNVGTMKGGAAVEFAPDGVYYNYSFNNLSGGVMVEHDPPEEKDKDAKATKK